MPDQPVNSLFSTGRGVSDGDFQDLDKPPAARTLICQVEFQQHLSQVQFWLKVIKCLMLAGPFKQHLSHFQGKTVAAAAYTQHTWLEGQRTLEEIDEF